MTEEYKATPEQWARLEQRQLSGNDLVGAVLELRARVKTLERRCEVQLMQLSDLQEHHHRLTLKVGHLECELVRDEDDLPQQHCLEAMDPPEANSQPEPQGPTDEELEAFAEPFMEVIDDGFTGVIHDEVAYARAVLARWGTPANNTAGTH
jgi:hypothetical protein